LRKEGVTSVAITSSGRHDFVPSSNAEPSARTMFLHVRTAILGRSLQHRITLNR
jgi:hypothetical protein